MSVGLDNFPLPPFADVDLDWVHHESVAAPLIRQFQAEEDLEMSAERTLGLTPLFL